ncbi:CoxG family protein [Bacillus chungangensis]|uniref:Carbon monoxide dehydrogenase subunit G n=1 Tax=Bacillus chungangensis TaxID=587633 RepID=A0ABT9WQ54_9BACI|nr:SRPBCC family protein [Bacillus chungangensis]MDQ0175278.1 carbon monoxide dehydrogenase subunit G [Bacillus chungangensis]
MSNGVHTIDLDLPIYTIWNFVSDMDHWAPLIPGYIEHEMINERISTWKFKSDLGIIKKTIHLQVNIKEWKEPTKVTFDLTGINENFAGHGYFQAEALEEKKTRMTGCLDITAKGAKAPMINAVLKSYVPKTTTEFSEAVAKRMEETAGIVSS